MVRAEDAAGIVDLLDAELQSRQLGPTDGDEWAAERQRSPDLDDR